MGQASLNDALFIFDHKIQNDAIMLMRGIQGSTKRRNDNLIRHN